MLARVVTTGAVGAPATVTCKLAINGSGGATSEALATLPNGHFGMTVAYWRVELLALHVLDRAP